MTTTAQRALNIDDVAARVDGLRIGGNVVGLAIVQAATDPDAPMVLFGQVASSLIRRSFLPGLVMADVNAEDLGIPENYLASADLSGLQAVRLTAARAIMPGASLVDARTPRGNFQHADLREADASGWDATGAFLEESDMRGLRVSPTTVLHGAHLADSRRTGVDLHADNVVGADFGPEGVSGGQPRKAARITRAAQIHSTRQL